MPRHAAFVREEAVFDCPLPHLHRQLHRDRDRLVELAQSAIELAHSAHCATPCSLVMPDTVLLDRSAASPGSVVVPMRWASDEGYAVLDGDLELRTANQTCHAELAAAYRQPVDAVGVRRPGSFDRMAATTAATFLGFLVAILGDGITMPLLRPRRTDDV